MAGKKRRKTDKYDRNVIRTLTMVTQFGINMLVPIFLCFFVGYFLDQRLGTSYLTVILFFVGALAGFRNIFLFARRLSAGDGRALKSRGEVAGGEEDRDDKKAE